MTNELYRRMLEQRPLRIDEHIEALESMRIKDAEEYNLVKIKLETDVQILEQQIQQVISDFSSYLFN